MDEVGLTGYDIKKCYNTTVYYLVKEKSNNLIGVFVFRVVKALKNKVMENKINLLSTSNPYLQHFTVAQMNLSKIIAEERLRKRIRKSKGQVLKPQ